MKGKMQTHEKKILYQVFRNIFEGEIINLEKKIKCTLFNLDV